MIDAAQAAFDELLSRRSVYPHWIQERVRWSDTDMIGHVNNLSFSSYFETGRTHFLMSRSGNKTRGNSLLVVARMAVNFLGEIHWPAEIDVGTGIVSIGRSSCRMGQALFDGERCVATADTVLVVIDTATRRPCEISERFRAKLTGLSLNTAS